MLQDKFQNVNFNDDNDLNIVTDSLKASLVCPLSKKRIEIPARGNDCKHLDCFDLKAHLVMNDKRSEWLCPICNKAGHFEVLYIDSYFVSILTKCSADKIQFLSHEDWDACLEDCECMDIISDEDCIVLE